MSDNPSSWIVEVQISEIPVYYRNSAGMHTYSSRIELTSKITPCCYIHRHKDCDLPCTMAKGPYTCMYVSSW